jgi:hypothetical protein
MTALRVGQVMMWDGRLWTNAEIGEGLPAYDVQVYGATADEEADQSDYITDALTAAAGKPVTGNSKTYFVSGSFTLPANAWLQDITIKQLDPDGAGNVRTLTSSSVDNIKLIRVKVDRNGDGTNGALATDAGIWIEGGTGHYFQDVEVYGDDMGSGFTVQSASKFVVNRLHVHDMNYSLGSDPGDDRIQGFWFNICSNFTLVDSTVHDLGGNFGAGATTRYTRNAFGDCFDFTVVNHRAWNIDQGSDMTGSGGNTNFQVVGGLCHDCFTYGFKFANSARNGSVTGATAIRCGASGFVVQGPNAVVDIKTSNILFENCTAIDTGSSGYWGSLATVAGFRVQEGSESDETRNIRFVNCRSIDEQDTPTTEYGIHNEVSSYNEVIDFESLGHIDGAIGGTWRTIKNLRQTHVRASRSVNEDTGAGVAEVIVFDTEAVDTQSEYNNATGVYTANCTRRIRVTAVVRWDSSDGDSYTLRIRRGGTVKAEVIQNADGATQSMIVSDTFQMDAADTIDIQVVQNNGTRAYFGSAEGERTYLTIDEV